MDDMTMLLRRADLRTLGRILRDAGLPIESGMDEPLSEEELREQVQDKLRLALRAGGENLDARVREVVEEAWETGERAGFMAGMRAGARVILSLTGEGPILI